MAKLFYACVPAEDRKRQIQIKVEIGTRKRIETGVVYPNFKAAEKDIARLNRELAS